MTLTVRPGAWTCGCGFWEGQADLEERIIGPGAHEMEFSCPECEAIVTIRFSAEETQ